MRLSLLHKKSGFTLAEMVISVGVVALVMSFAVPHMSRFLNQHTQRLEDFSHVNLREALKAYARSEGQLPPEEGWHEELARYSSFSPEQIRLDQWDQERVYVLFETTQTFQGTPLNVGYATIISAGIDGQMQTPTDWNQADGGDVDALILEAYSALDNESDDVLLKYTDNRVKVEGYIETEERLAAIGTALAEYANRLYSIRQTENDNQRQLNIANGTNDPLPHPDIDHRLYYPPSDAVDGVADNATYDPTAVAETSNVTGGGTIFNGSSHASRLAHMQGLMRLLGLPDEFCCSALHYVEIGGARHQKPFFYFSNPRPRILATNTCGDRPEGPFPGDVPRLLPVRLTVEVVPESDPGGRAPTCG